MPAAVVAPDAYDACRPVDIAPAERNELALTQASHRGDGVESVVRWAEDIVGCYCSQQRLELLCRSGRSRCQRPRGRRRAHATHPGSSSPTRDAYTPRADAPPTQTTHPTMGARARAQSPAGRAPVAPHPAAPSRTPRSSAPPAHAPHATPGAAATPVGPAAPLWRAAARDDACRPASAPTSRRRVASRAPAPSPPAPRAAHASAARLQSAGRRPGVHRPPTPAPRSVSPSADDGRPCPPPPGPVHR